MLKGAVLLLLASSRLAARWVEGEPRGRKVTTISVSPPASMGYTGCFVMVKSVALPPKMLGDNGPLKAVLPVLVIFRVRVTA